jgi:type II secretory pathway component GspD/PulD (secretin)
MPSILLLADAQMGIGDLNGAERTLAEADRVAITASQKKAIEKRRTRLSKLPIPPLALLTAADSLRLLHAPAETLAVTLPAKPEIYITNSFFETDLRQVLTDLSMQAGVSIIWDATVQGLVTYEAKERPLETVLKAILMPAGYSFSFQNGTYYVGSSNPKDPAFALLSSTEVVTLSNIDAPEAISLLSDYFEPYVKASKTDNTVCITAPQSIIERIRSDLNALDKPRAQILIEVVVCEFSVAALRKMGLDWSLTRSTGNPTWSIGTNHTDITGAAITGTYTELSRKIGGYTADLAASLEALVESGDAEIRAKPRITTLNGRTAEIALTRDQYFVIQTGTGQFYQYNQLQAVSSGIRLEITPYAASSGEITVYVKPEVGDVVGQGAQGLPEITKRTASTSVRVHDGETFTVGGLNLKREKNTQKKVPFVGDIPLLGYLFRYDEHEVKDTEIIIFVTPYLLSR